MKNALEILQFISYSTNAEVSKASSWLSVKKEALNGLNRAIRLLWNSKQWNFRREVKKLALIEGKNTLPLGGAELAQNGVRIANSPLVCDRAIPYYEPETGKPASYYITNKGKLILYPSADKRYTVALEVFSPHGVVAQDGTPKDAFSAETDTLNIPETLEPLFIDCLSYLVNELMNGDPTDEDYKEANLRCSEAYRLLEKADTTKDYDDSKGFKMPWQI